MREGGERQMEVVAERESRQSSPSLLLSLSSYLVDQVGDVLLGPGEEVVDADDLWCGVVRERERRVR